MHVPSHPFGWSAGNGGSGIQMLQIAVSQEHRPHNGADGEQFKLTTDKPKFMWQRGWWNSISDYSPL